MSKHSQNNHISGSTFQSLLAVIAHLDRAGFKISKSKIYRDRDKNFIRVNPDGTVPETEVRAYAAMLERKDGSIDDLNDVHVRRAEKDVELRALKIRKLHFDLEKEQGKYIPRADFESELAARAAVFDSGFRHAFNVKAREWIALVGGKPDKAADFLQALNRLLDDQLTGYATTRTFQVLFEEVG